ncbi:MAG TPA: hypothetical protein EYP59_13605 [Thiotrichaceae bacterium]|nr:hypothetical protein [Thiotrichaceae bacterium]
MNQTTSHAWISKLFPFLLWFPMLDRKTVKIDIVAGIIAGVLILPQAIALATLAGMPPEYGFYTAIFPVIIAVWFFLARLVRAQYGDVHYDGFGISHVCQRKLPKLYYVCHYFKLYGRRASDGIWFFKTRDYL